MEHVLVGVFVDRNLIEASIVADGMLCNLEPRARCRKEAHLMVVPPANGSIVNDG